MPIPARGTKTRKCHSECCFKGCGRSVQAGRLLQQAQLAAAGSGFRAPLHAAKAVSSLPAQPGIIPRPAATERSLAIGAPSSRKRRMNPPPSAGAI